MHRLPIFQIAANTRQRALLAWLLLCLLAVCPRGHAAEAAPLILSSAYWEDRSGQATLAQAQAQTYTPYQGIFNRGYSRSTHWLRLTLAASDAPIGLRLTPPWIDEITLHDPAQAGQRLTAGDRHPQGRAPRRFVWNPTHTMGAGSLMRWMLSEGVSDERWG